MVTPTLASSDLMSVLSEAALHKLDQVAVTRDLRRGEVIFREGDEAAELFVVSVGQVAIANRAPDGRESLVARLEAGSLFGELPLFDGQPRSADARALDPTQLSVLPYGEIRKVIDEEPSLLWALLGLLAQRLRAADEALADAVFLDVAGRTAKRLLDIAGTSEEFAIGVTQEELASMVGASRERVNRALAGFARLGWIVALDRGRYRMVDRAALERRATS